MYLEQHKRTDLLEVRRGNDLVEAEVCMYVGLMHTYLFPYMHIYMQFFTNNHPFNKMFVCSVRGSQ